MHLTRSDAGKRAEMLAYIERLKYYERLKRTEGLFMINSGQLSLALVASGHFAAYVNNCTNTWDIAAGEVLVRAVGGRVTDFKGNPIRYSDSKIDVIASTDAQLHDDLLSLVAETK
jgi:myo-inositol-1(or 4)-monophosphatase